MARTQVLAEVLGSGLISTLGTGGGAHGRALMGPPPAPERLAADELEAGKTLPYRSVVGGMSNAGLWESIHGALDQAGLSDDDIRAMGLFLGSSSLDIGAAERAYATALASGGGDSVPMGPGRTGYGTVAEQLAEQVGLRGPRLTFNTACSSSANAALYAARMIARGTLRHALVVGTEGFNRLSLLGFASLMLVADDRVQPFDVDRAGLVLGEGAGILILGPPGSGGRAQLCGGANRCDTSSATNSLPGCIARVMAEALDDAGVAATQLTAIKAHGTGTPSNDQAEGEGMKQLFGDALPAFTSLKGYFGHTLGACGALETAAVLATLDEGYLPATPGFATPDPTLGLHPITHPMAVDSGLYLLNYFGFGGNNTSLVLRYAP